MSKNRNRSKLNKAKDSREYTMITKNENLYCYICVEELEAILPHALLEHFPIEAGSIE
jgi:hypothetical protein